MSSKKRTEKDGGKDDYLYEKEKDRHINTQIHKVPSVQPYIEFTQDTAFNLAYEFYEKWMRKHYLMCPTKSEIKTWEYFRRNILPVLKEEIDKVGNSNHTANDIKQ